MITKQEPTPVFSKTPDFAQRKSFISLTAADESLLAGLGKLLPLDQIVRQFQEQLMSFQEMRTIGRDASRAQQFTQALERYFGELFGGVYDADYAASRMKLIRSHHQAGLELQWYLGAHLIFLRILTPHLWNLADGVRELFLSYQMALLKVVFLDLGLAMSAYSKANDLGSMDSERRFQASLESAGDGIVLLDEEGCIWHVNQATEKMFGYSRKELMGKTLTLLMPDAYRLANDAAIVTLLTALTPSPTAPHVTEGQRKNGSIFPMEYTIGANQFEGKRLITCILRDSSWRQ